MRRAQQSLPLVALLAVLGCTHQESLPTPPTVVAGHDLTMGVRAIVRLGATGSDPDGSVVRFDWALVTAPDPSKASLSTRGARSEVLELSTGALPGLYVLSVSATDDDGLVSEPQYINLTLLPQAEVAVEILCLDGCDPLASTPRAGELTTLTLEARASGGVPAGYRWSVAFDRAPEDALTGEPSVRDLGSQIKVTLPRVAYQAGLVVALQLVVVGGPDPAASLELAVANSVDEPPELRLEWRRPGDPAPVGAVPPTVLPGDALWVTALASDPNGDTVECSFPEFWGLPTERLTGSDPCRLTLFPLMGGSLEVVGAATTAQPAARTESATLRIPVRPFSLESAGPGLSAVALDEAGRALAVGPSGELYLYRNGRRDTFLAPGMSGGTAVALSAGVSPALGFAGWSAGGAFSVVDVDAGRARASLGWGALSEPPTETRRMARGSAGRLFATTDRGLGVWDGQGLSLHPAPGAEAPLGLAVGPSPEPHATSGWVWFGAGSTIWCHPSERPEEWGEAVQAGNVEGYEITALSASSGELGNLWAGTGPAGAGVAGRGLILFRQSVDAASGAPSLGDGEPFLAGLGTVGSVAVEQQGPYAGDAWAVAGESLVRVSRAAVNDPEGGRADLGLQLSTGLGSAAVRAVAVGAGAERKVVLASDEGMATAP